MPMDYLNNNFELTVMKRKPPELTNWNIGGWACPLFRWRGKNWLKALSLLIYLIAFLTNPSITWAVDDSTNQAKAHFLQGKKYYTEGKYLEAIESFKSAAEIHASPLLDFNIGRCFDKLDRYSEALKYYEKYLAAKKDATNREEVRSRIITIKQLMKKNKSKSQDPYEQLELAPEPSPAPTSQPVEEKKPQPAPPTFSRQKEQTPPPSSPSDIPHEATQPRSWSNQDMVPAPPPYAPSPYAPYPEPDTRPIYKQGWFWVACVTGAIITSFIVYTVATSSFDNTSSHTTGLQIRY